MTCPELTYIPYASADVSPFSAKTEYEDEVVYTCDEGYVVENLLGLNDDTKTLYNYTEISFKVTCKADGCWSAWPLPYCVRE